MSVAPHDPETRRDTPLALKLKDRIRRSGPITVADYMRACLGDPEHGYYVRRQAIGSGGDFVTAPEISQVFGELIGLWSAVVWQQMGSPVRFNLVELGPGRGTMLHDALRATRIVPGFRASAHVHLVESNAVLVEQQRSALAELAPDARWHRDLAGALGRAGTIPRAPTIIVANEFLDALPISQFVRKAGRWHERTVTLDDGGDLMFAVSDHHEPAFEPTAPDADVPDDTIAERCADATFFAYTLLHSLAETVPFAALLIDYGHARAGFGDTLQAVKDHAHVSPLHAPGECDLTAHVDFETFALATAAPGHIAVDGPVTQAEFLGSLGIMERASRLMSANPHLANEIEMGIARLMGVPGMGDRFKAIGARSAGLPPLPGF